MTRCIGLKSQRQRLKGSNRNSWFLIASAIVCATGLFPPPSPASAQSTDASAVDILPLQAAQGITSRPAGFSSLPANRQGIDFVNQLTGDVLLTNAVAHNGSGLAIGDINNDGLPDLYFCGLQSENRLYQNLGNWRFESVQEEIIGCPEQLSTGAALADIDNDGDLDLLVNGVATGTKLFLNDGLGHFSPSPGSGLRADSSPTSMALADYDNDGDLDLYCTHYIDTMHLADRTTRFSVARKGGAMVVTAVNLQPTTTRRLANRFQVLPRGRVREIPERDILYRNLGDGRFEPVNHRATFLSSDGSPLGLDREWGLAVSFRDLNGDGTADLYVCNDNASPDRVWMNQGNGTFHALPGTALGHTSRSSMGVDVADFNRDGIDDLFVLDMLARDPDRRRQQLVRELPNPSAVKSSTGLPRYNHNTLFAGNTDGSYREIAFMAGVAATDWSWCPLFLDVDLDGYEDLLVSNGFSFDVMDADSNDRIKTNELSPAQLKRSRQLHPSWPTPNAAFKNNRNGRFSSASEAWGFDIEGISYGMASGDLDQDGDADVIINQLNSTPLLLRNESTAPRIKVSLRSQSSNTFGIGASVRLKGKSLTQSQQLISGGRYLSSDSPARTFAFPYPAGEDVHLEVLWPNGTLNQIRELSPNQHYVIHQRNTRSSPLPVSNPSLPTLFTEQKNFIPFQSKAAALDLGRIQPTLPRRVTQSRASAHWYDADQDGWEDLFVTTGLGNSPGMFKNNSGKGFLPWPTPPSPADLGDVVGWSNGQGQHGWLVARSILPNNPRAGSAVLFYHPGTSPEGTALLSVPGTIGSLATADIDQDGDLDLFVGGHALLGQYPRSAPSNLWINESGKLVADETRSEALKQLDLVNDALFIDLDQDQDQDLVVAAEWSPIRVFENRDGTFLETTNDLGLTPTSGWWTSLAAGDFNEDGQLDLVAGNWGPNSSAALYGNSTHRLYFGDSNQDGRLETLEAVKPEHHWKPILDRNRLKNVFPQMEQQFPTHAEFVRQTVDKILSSQIGSFDFISAREQRSLLLLRSNDTFSTQPLPSAAQESPVFSIAAADFNGDGHQDLFLSQNYYGTHFDLTRNDSGRGLLLLGRGNATFDQPSSAETGFTANAELRGVAVTDYNRDGALDLLVTEKSGPVHLLQNRYQAQASP